MLSIHGKSPLVFWRSSLSLQCPNNLPIALTSLSRFFYGAFTCLAFFQTIDCNLRKGSFDTDFYDILLQTCRDLKPLKQIHSYLTSLGLIQENPHLSAQVIANYSRRGDLESARLLFDTIKGCRSFLWNTMIRVYTNGGQYEETLELYSLMRQSGINPNNYTFPFVFKACGSSSWISKGKSVHLDVVKTGFQSDMYVEAALVDMYAKCGEIDDGRKVFDEMSSRDLVCWTAMITAYEQSERPAESLSLFCQMQLEGFVADSVTIVTITSAVGQLGDLKKAQSVHSNSIHNGFIEDVNAANSIVTMYSRCGEVESARVVFDSINEKDVISWNSMLSGYSQNGNATDALSLFDAMLASGVKPNSVTALIAVSSCAYLGSLCRGRKIQDFIISSRMEIDTTLSNAIMDMYAKCGDLATAMQLFNSRPVNERDVSSWNVMLSGYGMHGHGRESLDLFSRMQEEGVRPNHITFTCLLSACSHAGLVEEGRKLFDDMGKKLSVNPLVKHYVCMVDLLGRAGLLEEAYALIAEMPPEPNDEIWGALLGACRIHRNAELGEFAAKNLFQLEDKHTGYYVLLSNIYAASSKWHEVRKLRQDLKGKGMKKPAAFSLIELGNEVHGFHTADQTHPECVEVYRKVESLVFEMRMAGYVPDASCVLHDVEEEDKENLLNSHCEKLALAFGLMKIEVGLPVHVTKNLRVCNDCHSAFKLISYTQKRTIIVRDANRFHHFQNGLCSCNDYW
ncbi:pentatricopeptide repeat-containing protein At3g12770-like [Aristolochia californica]|uniref:pentatricopeptide repeat-containing protein At3g12770-like n=1 Tax=Aristolochia californica TaxID=171875 RepID=UPI0035D9035C